MNTISSLLPCSARSAFLAFSIWLVTAASAPAQALSSYISNLTSGSAGYTECNGWYEWIWIDEDYGEWVFYEECHWVHNYYWTLDTVEVTGTVPNGEVRLQVTYSDSSVQNFVRVATGGPFYHNIFYTEFGPAPVSAYAFQINPLNDATWPSPVQAFYNNPDADWDAVTLYDPGDSDTRDMWALGSVTTAMAWDYAIGLARRMPFPIPGWPDFPAAPQVWEEDAGPSIGAVILYQTLVRIKEEIKRRRETNMFSFVTYEMKNPTLNKYYVGRTSGQGDPLTVLHRRLARHAVSPLYPKGPANGWTIAGVNSTMSTTGFQEGAWFAMRGREQQILDHHLYVASPSHSMDNRIRAVAVSNPRAPYYHATSNLYFPPELFPYIGSAPYSPSMIVTVYSFVYPPLWLPPMQ